MLARGQKQMGMFQFNTVPGGGVAEKTPDLGLMSGDITRATFQPRNLWQGPSRRSLTDEFIIPFRLQPERREAVQQAADRTDGCEEQKPGKAGGTTETPVKIRY